MQTPYTTNNRKKKKKGDTTSNCQYRCVLFVVLIGSLISCEIPSLTHN